MHWYRESSVWYRKRRMSNVTIHIRALKFLLSSKNWNILWAYPFRSIYFPSTMFHHQMCVYFIFRLLHIIVGIIPVLSVICILLLHRNKKAFLLHLFSPFFHPDMADSSFPSLGPFFISSCEKKWIKVFKFISPASKLTTSSFETFHR